MFKILSKVLPSLLISISIFTVAWNTSVAAQEERILSFKSHIKIHADASLEVTETITVESAQDLIERGIYRDFPVSYVDRSGKKRRVGFKLKSVLRNGANEPHHVENKGNEKRIYIGEKNTIIPPGTHTYELTYLTTKQIGYFEKFDELYWNVTGNAWKFKIDRAEAKIDLPPGASIVETAGYTGAYGSTENAYEQTTTNLGQPVFRTTRSLSPGEGFTIAVSWPKGFVEAIEPPNKIFRLISTIPPEVASIVGLAILGIYCFISWMMVGRDGRGTVIPRFAPPRGISPAGARYISKMSFSDTTSFTAAIVNMAVNGYLTIQKKDSIFVLEKTNVRKASLFKGEQAIAKALFPESSSISLKQENYEIISSAESSLDNTLAKELRDVLIVQNSIYFLPALLIYSVSIGVVSYLSDISLQMFFAAIASLIGGGFAATTFVAAYNANKFIKSISSVIFGLGCCVFIFIVTLHITDHQEISASFTSALSGLVLGLYWFLIAVPTEKGRQLITKLEGLKLYLSVAEKDRMQMVGAPNTTPELFEKLLPYAIALGVGNEWGEHFSSVLSAAGKKEEDYYPYWYPRQSNWRREGFSGMADDISDQLSSEISAAAESPDSGSGSSGFGFSGGGGGGGGGGGW